MADRTLTVRLQANISDLRAGLGAASAQVKGFGSDVSGAASSTSQSTDKLGRGFLIAGGIIAAGLAVGAAAAIEFEQDMRNVVTISDFVGENFDKVSEKVLAMSNNLPQSASELAKGLYDIASSGFAGAEGMTVLEVSAKAASAGLSDTATSGRAITGVLNAYGMSAKDARDVSDVLFQTVNLGVVTFDELAQNLGDVVGLAAQLKIPIKDVGAAIATITLAGVPAAEATTALNRVMQSMIAPSDALIEKFHSWGFESGEAAVKALGLSGIMLRLRKETDGNVTAMQQFFPESRALKGALALTAAEGENYERVLKGMDSATKGNGATAKALAEQQKALGYQLTIVKNQIVNTAIAFMSELLPAMKVGADIAKQVFSTFSDMPGPMKTVVAVLAAVSAGALILGGSMLLVTSRIAHMKAEMLLMGDGGVRAVAAMGMLARGIALASGAALAAYGFAALDGSLEGTVTGVLSLLAAVSLLRPGLAGLQSGLTALSSKLTASAGFASAGVAVGNLAGGVGRLGQVLPGLALSGMVAASTMGHVGESSLGAVANMASMTATGAQLGFVLGGPVGAAIGGVAGMIAGPLMNSLGIGGESVDAYREKFAKLSTELDSLGEKQALKRFIDQLGDTDKLKLFAGDVRGITDEVRALAKTSPDAALKIVAGLKTSQLGANLTAADFRKLNAVIEGQVVSNAKADASREKSKKSNDAIKQAHKELGAAAVQMSEAEETAAENTAKAMQKIADSAVAAFPTVKGAFDSIQGAAAEFGVAMDPAILLAGFQEKLAAELAFGQNVTTIMQAGFVQIGNVIAQEGPEKGAAVAAALVAGIKSGDLTVAQALDDTAKMMTIVPATLASEFATTWGPQIDQGLADATANMSPYIRGLFGLTIPGAVAESAPATVAQFEAAATAAALGYSGPIQGIPNAAIQAQADANAGVLGLVSSATGAGAATGDATAGGFAGGVAPIPGVAGTAVAGATGAVTGGAGALAGAGTAAGQGTTAALGTGLSGMPAMAGTAVANTAAAFDLAATVLGPLATGVGVGIGQDFSTGIAIGIDDYIWKIEAAAAKAVNDAEAAARGAADSTSPSKLFAALGRDLSAGVVVGIRAGLPEARAAAAELVGVGAGSRADFGVLGRTARGAVVEGSRQVTVHSVFAVSGNIYGDNELKRKMTDAADDRDRKLANDLRRKRI